MTQNRKLSDDKQAHILMHEIEQRIQYEIMLEYGLTSKLDALWNGRLARFFPFLLRILSRLLQQSSCVLLTNWVSCLGKTA